MYNDYGWRRDSGDYRNADLQDQAGETGEVCGNIPGKVGSGACGNRDEDLGRFYRLKIRTLSFL
jgi:hypothetical protein